MKIQWATLFKKCTLDEDTFPFGIRFYDAPMGGGKTLSMLNDTFELVRKYHDVHIFSNVLIHRDDLDIVYYNTTSELIACLEQATKYKHSIVIIDEGLSYFAENGGIDPALMSSITQTRKNRIFILISSQKFKRINNRIRDFSLETVVCRCYFGKLQWNIVRDDTNIVWDKEQMDFVGTKKYSVIFKRNNDLFNSYDTYQKINITTNTSALFSPRGSPIAVEAKQGKKLNLGVKK